MSLVGLGQALPGHDPHPVVRERRRADVRLEHRRLRFLHLQDQPVAARVARTFEQADPAPGSHAADPDDPPGDVDDAVPVEQVADLVRQRLPVAVDHRGDVVHVVHGGAQVHGERWVLDEPDRVAVARGQLRDRAPVVFAARLLDVAFHRRSVLRREVRDDVLDVRARVPEVDGRELRGVGHVLPIRADCGGHDLVERRPRANPDRARRHADCPRAA